MNYNWLIRCYDEDEKMTSSFVITDRTEHEAQREAENDSVVKESYDWSMITTKRTR